MSMAQQVEIIKLKAELGRVREVLSEIDDAIDRQVYGLRSASPARGMRNADLDIPDNFEHDVLITERLWDRIRSELRQGAQ